jgi:hypothetical protein
MAGGEWNTSRERKQQATDAREADRERIRLEKRQLRDFRWSAERSTLRLSLTGGICRLHCTSPRQRGPQPALAGAGPLLVPVASLNGGTPCPPDLRPDWLKLSAEKPRTKPTTRKAPGAPRKTRADKGTTGRNYTPRKTKP